MRGLLIDDMRELKRAWEIACVRYPRANAQLNQVTEWKVARTLDDAKALLDASVYDVLLVDHDLGDTDTDGSHALAHLCDRYARNTSGAWLPAHVYAVSSNPVGVKRIEGWTVTIAELRHAGKEI